MAGKKSGAKVIVVTRKKVHHGGHHGGSWKVAYADFVTAMMAFFMVMWIMGMDQGVRDMVEGYFSNPVGFKRAYSGGTNVISAGNAPVNMDVKRLALLARDYQRQRFEEAKAQIEEVLSGSQELQGLQAQVEIVITDEGLRIELVEDGTGETFFAFGSATLRPAAAQALAIIAAELRALPNDLKIEGHTDSARYGRPGYSNWELSADRANAARRAMEAGGLTSERILEVRGYADRQLRRPDEPLSPVNRRVSMLLPFKEPRAVGIARQVPAPLPVQGAD